jgi:dienelactone hydrolase
MRPLLSIAAMLFGFYCIAQKTALTIADTKTWTNVRDGKISNDGRFVSYTIYHQPKNAHTLVLQAVHGGWKTEIVGGSNDRFSANSKWAFCKVKDTLFVFETKTRRSTRIPNIKEFTTANDYLIFRDNSFEKKLFIRNLLTEQQQEREFISSYTIDPTSSFLVMESQENDNLKVQLLKLGTGIVNTLWSDKLAKPLSFSWDDAGEQLAFFIEHNENGKMGYQIVYYHMGMQAADIIAFDSYMAPGFTPAVNWGLKIINNERRIMMFVQSDLAGFQKQDVASLNVWSYFDSVDQSKQQLDLRRKKVVYAAVFDLVNRTITRIEHENERILESKGDQMLLVKRFGLEGEFEAGWNKSAQLSYYLVSLKNALRVLINENTISKIEQPMLSPNGNWLVWFDKGQQAFFSYETASGKKRCITKNGAFSWLDEENDTPEPAFRQFPVWLPDEKGIIVYDSYDVWLLDPSGKNVPRNLTNGYGRKHQLKFSLLDNLAALNKPAVDESIFLKAINKGNLETAFYRIALGRIKDPELLSKGQYLVQSSHPYITKPVKAKDARVYLGLRCSAIEAPNYFVTEDFKQLKFLSNVQPQRNFNWYSTELIKWKSLDGTSLQGILYKPENFDSTKKYPVIFQYYEKRSDELNSFLIPEPSSYEINIPLFVSNGYLVFAPDIHYKLGLTGTSAYNAVVSAANFLSNMPWVDVRKMGLQGHSFGGFETAYIVTHTGVFAAACSAAGIYDMVSFYTSGIRANYQMYHAERIQGRLGKNLWEAPSEYLENSPILQAHKLSTPLLMMHNKGDGIVPFAQGIQFFMALRRLGKIVWMLEYEQGDHALNYGKEAEDFHTRMMQFFDHYLKDSACPKWMLQGISARDKGFEDGLELIKEKDPKTGKWITAPEGGLLTEEEKKKVETLRRRKPITIKF